MKDLKYEHQSIKMGRWWAGWRVGGWRVHGVGVCVCDGVGGGGVHGWVGGWTVNEVGAYTHPPMNSYNVKI